MNNMIEKIIERIKIANESYRVGKPIISDSDYDSLIEELTILDPNNDLLSKVGHQITEDSRKRKLQIDMASMNKVKTIEEILDWSRLKSISQNEEVVITPKFDGLSLLVDEKRNQATTRGDGSIGQDSDKHYQLIQNKLENSDNFQFTWGEVMMKKDTFIQKYSKDFANPRNLVAGLLNSKEATESLSDCHYIKYGATTTQKFEKKSHILDELNKEQTIKVPYIISKISNLEEEKLHQLFSDWSKDFEIDGLIIEIDNLSLQKKLGRETTTNNPVWARAYKSPLFEQKAETEVIDISWNISKQGYLKPTIHIKPVKLDGVTVSNITGNNARFIKDLGIGKGAKVICKRSGMVIPVIVNVTKTVEFKMPNIENIDWNEAGVELVTLNETDEQKLKKNIAFFEILEADNVSEGVITQLWNAGYTTIKDILNLKKSDLEKIEGFGKRKSEIVWNSIQKSITGVQLSKIQHATGIFAGLGSKKLALLEHFTTKPTLEQVMAIEGFAEISAKSYIDSWDVYQQFVKDLPITIQKKVEIEKTSSDLEGMVAVFTGIRDKEAEDKIISRGGKIGSSVSKNTTHLICKDPNSGSSKLEKAKSLGVKIISLEELYKLF